MEDTTAPPTRRCLVCSKEFEPRRANMMCCTRDCAQKKVYNDRLAAQGKTRKLRQRIDWTTVLFAAEQIVTRFAEENEGILPTARKLHYKLTKSPDLFFYPNDKSAYSELCRRTAEMRRNGDFPDLADSSRKISRPLQFTSTEQARATLRNLYRRPRAETQKYNIYIANEKKGMEPLLESWFHDRGLAVVCLAGNHPTQLLKDWEKEIKADGRPAVILYVGDYDASGLAIYDRLRMRLGTKVGKSNVTYIHVGLTKAQVREYDLPKAPGKDKVAACDQRAFVKKNGENVQVEEDALDESVLKELYETALAPYWDQAAYDAVLEREAAERSQL